MEEKKLLLLLLNNKFYTEHKHLIVPEFFPNELLSVYQTLTKAQEELGRDINLAELRALHNQEHPTLTRAAKDSLSALFRSLNEEADEPIGADVGKAVLNSMWRKEQGRRIAEEGLQIAEGTQASLSRIQDLLSTISDNFTPVVTSAETSTDLDDILTGLSGRVRWEFNIPSLKDKVPGGGPGDFIIEFARPEVGKTAFWVSLVAAPGGFLWQGAKVLAIVNEEPAIRTMGRLVSAATGMTLDEIKSDKPKAKAEWSKISDSIVVLDDTQMTIEKLEVLCKKYKPDIVICDQLDKLGIGGVFAREDQKLLQLYTEARNIGKRQNCLVFGVSQASAEAEDKTFVHFSMMDNSKTGKAAQADIIIGIGKQNQNDGNATDSPVRHLYISKNKLNGWHGKVICVLDNVLSRYRS